MNNSKQFQFTLSLLFLLSVLFLGFHNKEQNDFDRKPMDVGVVVSDLERSLDFYTNVIGMIKVGTYHVTPEGAKTSGLTDGKAIDIINLKLNDEPGTSYIS